MDVWGYSTRHGSGKEITFCRSNRSNPYRRFADTPRWTLLLEERGKDDATFRLFCPIVAYGARGEAFAATLEPGDLIAVTGKLGWSKPQPTKHDPTPQGKLCVLASQVERLTPISTPAPISTN